MTKSLGPWFLLLLTYNSITEGMLEASVAKLNNNRDTDK